MSASDNVGPIPTSPLERCLLWRLVLGPSLHILQRSLLIPYHFPLSLADFFVTIAPYCIEPLEAVQGLLLGAHRHVWEDRELGMIKVEN